MQNRYITQRFIYSEDGQEAWRIRDTEQGNKIMCTCLVEENATKIAAILNSYGDEFELYKSSAYAHTGLSGYTNPFDFI